MNCFSECLLLLCCFVDLVCKRLVYAYVDFDCLLLKRSSYFILMVSFVLYDQLEIGRWTYCLIERIAITNMRERLWQVKDFTVCIACLFVYEVWWLDIRKWSATESLYSSTAIYVIWMIDYDSNKQTNKLVNILTACCFCFCWPSQYEFRRKIYTIRDETDRLTTMQARILVELLKRNTWRKILK